MADERKPGRPPTDETEEVSFMTNPLVYAYLEDLVSKKTFGRSKADVARRFVTDAINELIASGRLQERT